MDALADYGSETSSDNDEESSCSPVTHPAQGKNNLDAVLQLQPATVMHPGEHRPKAAVPSDIHNVADIPRPLTTGSDNAVHKLTLFGKDYIEEFKKQLQCKSFDPSPLPSSALEEKLDNLHQSLKDEDFASHLKKQKDFTNPSIFPQVIKYFQIDGAGSNLPKDIWDPYAFQSFEFIEKLTVSEERAARRRLQDDNS